jgi:hypothetical protein
MHKLYFRYIKLGLQRLGLDSDVTEEILEKAEALLNHWRAVVAFYTIRLSLSPAVETLLLLDRQLYLYEQGMCKQIQSNLFNPDTLVPSEIVRINEASG